MSPSHSSRQPHKNRQTQISDNREEKEKIDHYHEGSSDIDNQVTDKVTASLNKPNSIVATSVGMKGSSTVSVDDGSSSTHVYSVNLESISTSRSETISNIDPVRSPFGAREARSPAGKSIVKVNESLHKDENNFFIDFPGSISTPSICIQFSPFTIFSHEKGQCTPSAEGLLRMIQNSQESSNDNGTAEAFTNSPNTIHVSPTPVPHTRMTLSSAVCPVDPKIATTFAHGSSNNIAGKRKTSNIVRQPQKRFCCSIPHGNELGISSSFGIKKDGKSRLTTNTAREVRVINIMTGENVCYSSCSEAARSMQVNRTKLSRSESVLIE